MPIRTREEEEERKRRREEKLEEERKRKGIARSVQARQIEERRRAGQEFVQARERRAGKLIEAGEPATEATRERAMKQLQEELAARGGEPVTESEREFLTKKFLELVEKERGELPPSKLMEFAAEGGGIRGATISEAMINKYSKLTGISVEDLKEHELTSQFIQYATQSETGKYFSKLTDRVLRLGGTVKVPLIDTSVDDMLDFVLEREKAEELQTAIGRLGQMSSAIEGIRMAGGATTAQTIAELDRKSRELDTLEARMNQASILNPEVKLSGKYFDLMLEVEEARIDIKEAMAGTLDAAGEFDPETIQLILDELKPLYRTKV